VRAFGGQHPSGAARRFLSPETLLSGAGGFAAAIAIGGFLGQGLAIVRTVSDEERRRETAVGGFAGLVTMIGLILFSIGGR
jgi:hypothetical protein